ncbi:Carboxylesterase [Opisthorchis viverrini]|uniref:Carboxylic ester hydrolase n=1 Tax=Opisthorchis viverrini TaxID=6198 RepID=A0A1S8X8A1_OPIVI|nr:Carboxylesterase [Opisthorchis viverrini]
MLFVWWFLLHHASICALADLTPSEIFPHPINLSKSDWKCPSDRPATITTVGTFCGIREVVHWPDGMASKVDIYYGIRYGQPPVGRLRFRKPVPPPAEPDKVFSANELQATCPQPRDTLFQECPAARMWQPNTLMSEDCLFLNIWVPSHTPSEMNSNEEKLAVMLWIYGGSFYTGTSTLSVYDGRFLAARQNVIVASLNYRVGPFGFLFTDQAEVPGNMGLWDQRLAMKWVKDHIGSFGGDPERITLFGESAGAVSVSAHLLSPWSHAFFTNAVMQSGSILGNWAVSNAVRALEQTNKFSKILGCTGNAVNTIDCLRKKSVKEILDAHDAMFNDASYFSVPFPPVLDQHFLPYENGLRLRQMRFMKTTGSVMFGINKNEGSYFLLYAFVNNSDWRGEHTQLPIRSRAEYLTCLRRVLELQDDIRPELTDPLIRYIDFEYETYDYIPTLASWTRRLEVISSDRSFKCPTITMANTATNQYVLSGPRIGSKLPVYFYEFQHRTASVQWPEWAGTMHGYEIEYVFGIPFSPQFQATFYRFTDEERRLSDMMMTYWANFARTGDPNILPLDKDVLNLNSPAGEAEERVDSVLEPKHITDYLEQVRLPGSLAKCEFSNWPQYLNETASYLIFGEEAGKLSVGSAPRRRQCLFWQRWYPALLLQISLLIITTKNIGLGEEIARITLAGREPEFKTKN